MGNALCCMNDGPKAPITPTSGARMNSILRPRTHDDMHALTSQPHSEGTDSDDFAAGVDGEHGNSYLLINLLIL